MAQGSLGLGESYMEGEWDSESIDELFHHLLNAQLGGAITYCLVLALSERVTFSYGSLS